MTLRCQLGNSPEQEQQRLWISRQGTGCDHWQRENRPWKRGLLSKVISTEQYNVTPAQPSLCKDSDIREECPARRMVGQHSAYNRYATGIPEATGIVFLKHCREGRTYETSRRLRVAGVFERRAVLETFRVQRIQPGQT